MAAEDQEDPLIKALPPASDYLTYLTILEYQLTPVRLPILHRVLQDETLTTNIGWDLVQLLLPLLPASEDCLQDIARLGNPREVILRVSDALMTLQPSLDEEENEATVSDEDYPQLDTSLDSAEKPVPLHILQFNSLVSMLTVLHARIKTKYPSRFIATSLHAALEAYTEYPTLETTTAIVEYLRDISGNKRPALPPRNASEQLIQRTTGAQAPDPEAEDEAHPENSTAQETALIQKLVQFGLMEALKIFLLHCTGKAPPGMQWTIRVQEKLDKDSAPSPFDLGDYFSRIEHAKERDTTVGKILALSRDFGLESKDLLQVALNRGDSDASPLDFENLPKSAAEIPLEPHGCLIMLAARYSTAVLFDSTQPETNTSVYRNIPNIFENFLRSNEKESIKDVAAEAPIPLLDSLLVLALISIHREPNSMVRDEYSFKQLLLTIVACVRVPSMRRLSRVERVPLALFHTYPNAQTKYDLIFSIFSDDELQYAREPAISWLKQELLSTTQDIVESVIPNPFMKSDSFSTLFRAIYKPLPSSYSSLSSLSTSALFAEVINFTQHDSTLYISALNFYYLLCKSDVLRQGLKLQELNAGFRRDYLNPMKAFAQSVTKDPTIGERVEKEFDEGLAHMSKSVADVVLHVIGEIEIVEWEDSTHSA
ncbi:YAP1-binding protein 1 [Ophidiomyces ophidiicola]|nr:YAP1-binding protein 1 [Ophidiomyces ophidiicola]